MTRGINESFARAETQREFDALLKTVRVREVDGFRPTLPEDDGGVLDWLANKFGLRRTDDERVMGVERVPFDMESGKPLFTLKR